MAKEFNIKNWQNKNLLNEQSFDAGLANAMGMSGDEFEDQVASRDIGDDSFGAAGTDKRTQQVITDIIQLIKSTDIDPMDVMEVIGEEFDIRFEFSGGAPGAKQADDMHDDPGDIRIDHDHYS